MNINQLTNLGSCVSYSRMVIMRNENLLEWSHVFGNSQYDLEARLEVGRSVELRLHFRLTLSVSSVIKENVFNRTTS